MSAPPPETPSLPDRVWFALKCLVGLFLAAAFAFALPFDNAFLAATFNVRALRPALIVLLALIGAFFGHRIGLKIDTRIRWSPAIALGVALATALWCVGCDAVWPHEALVDAMVTRGHPPGERVLAFMVRAFDENILYRLFLSSVLIWLLGLVWKRPDGRPAIGAFVVGFLIAQAANAAINMIPTTGAAPMQLAYDTARYVVPGFVWAALYWRYGFQANEIACTSVHAFLQPMFQAWFV